MRPKEIDILISCVVSVVSRKRNAGHTKERRARWREKIKRRRRRKTPTWAFSPAVNNKCEPRSGEKNRVLSVDLDAVDK